ncbi:MAG: aminoglycoside phosphotransferase family protein [Nocardioidaceae bacterium]
MRSPRFLAEVLDAWGLEPSADAVTRKTVVVVPVVRDGRPLALKVTWPAEASRAEALALRHWNGRGAVRLVAADPARGAVLLEALDGARDLGSADAETACEVIGGLLAELQVPAPPGLRTLSSFAREQVAQLSATQGVLPRRMVERTQGLVRTLATEPSCDSTLLHTRLYVDNVLASLPGSGRPDWLAIGPRAMAGHPGFEIQPLLRHRVDELGTGSALRYLVRRRVSICAEAAGIDEDEALAWSYVRTAFHAGRAGQNGDAAVVSFCIALLKALDG